MLWSKFLFKTRFQKTAKSVLMRPQGLRPRKCSPLAPSLFYATVTNGNQTISLNMSSIFCAIGI